MESRYHCNICDKNYKTYQTLWKHNKTFHTEKTHILSSKNHPNDDSLSSKYHPKDDTLSSKYHPNESNLKIKKTLRKICNYCNTEYSCYKNVFKHEKKCKENPINKKEIILSNTNIQKEILDLLNLDNVDKRTINKINSLLKKMHNNDSINNINSNNSVNNSHNNNGTINNTINIIQLGKENLSDILDKKEKLHVLNKKNNAVLELIELAHFNTKYPQLHSIILTNKNTNTLYLYNEEKKIFKLTNKNEAIDQLIECKICDIEEFYEEHKNVLTENVKRIIETIIDDRYENDDKPVVNKQIRDNINNLLYNNRNTVKHLL